MSLILHCQQSEHLEYAKELAQELSCPLISDLAEIQIEEPIFILVLDENGLSLQRHESNASQSGKKPSKNNASKLGALHIDFADGALTWRRNHGGGTGQAVAKAIGLKNKKELNVLDATAGTGTDAFVLAALGCKVKMVERHPVVGVLLQDALSRASDDDDVNLVTNLMSLHKGSSLDYMLSQDENSFDVVYLDPMFPKTEKTGKNAQVKKSMQYFRDMVGKDEDANDLLAPALKVAKYRVVVKRPRKSPFLDGQKPSHSQEGKANRFDIYVKQGMRE